MYKRVLRPMLFSLDPERVHGLALLGGRIAQRQPLCALLRACCVPSDERLAVKAFGLTFPNPIGLAAGFDKDAEALEFFAALGFGYIEAGTVTAEPQPGNPKPRIFRIPAEEALINRMGFPSLGADAVAARLRKLGRLSVPLGVNIGKSKVTPLDAALADYRCSFAKLRAYGDLFVVNVSSPNTPELRKLQQRDRLNALLQGVQELNAGTKPLLVKVAPDLSLPELDEVLACCEASAVAGIVATNTTIARDELQTPSSESGGLSGRPLRRKAREFVSYILQHSRLPVIAVGGISTADDVIDLFKLGALMVQVYTGFIYEGPFMVKRLCRGLCEYMDREGLRSLEQLRGAGR